MSVNYKLALTKSIANDWTTKAFAICLDRDWTPCCYKLSTFNNPWGSSRWRESLCAPGNLVGWSLDSWMFLAQILSSQSLHPLISRDTLNPWWPQTLMTNKKKTFCKLSASWYWTPPSPKPYMLTFPDCHFGAVSQSYLSCWLPGCSPHFAPNKTELTTLKFYIFF